MIAKVCIICAALIFLVLYACCVAAGKADERIKDYEKKDRGE